MAIVEVGEQAPLFSLKDKDGKTHSLEGIKSDYIAVYFYPRDSTPGCTTEALRLNKELPTFDKLNTTILGISGGDSESKKEFCEENKLKLTLLSDTDFSVAKTYGVYVQKSFMGRKFPGISRTTFVLDRNHEVLKVFHNVNPLKHANELISYIRSLGGGI